MSLVELMVALALGLLITAGLIQIFLGTKQSYSSNEALARVQENGRFALSAFQVNARMASNRPFCGARIAPNVLLNIGSDDAGAIYGLPSGLVGWEFGGTAPGDAVSLSLDNSTSAGSWSSGHPFTPDLPAQFLASADIYPLPGSDVFMIQYLEPVTANVAAPSGSNEITLEDVDPSENLQNDEIFLATTCTPGPSQNVMFQGAVSGTTLTPSGGGSPGNAVTPTLQVFEPGAQVFQRRAVAYFVGFSGRRGEPGLYSLDFSRSLANPLLREEVQGVESIQVLYGTSDTTGRFVDNWQTAAAVTQWNRVIAARVSLLVRSDAPAGDAPPDETFDLLGTQYTVPADVGDRRLREVFATTLLIRNQAMQL